MQVEDGEEDLLQQDPAVRAQGAGDAPRLLGSDDSLSRQQVLRRAAYLGVTAIVLYTLAPALIEIYSSARDLSEIRFLFLLVMIALMSGSLACTWVLLRTALPEASWFAASTSQLSANAFSRAVPGGAAAGGALQYRMLTRAGVDTTAAATALTAVSLITTGVVFALPVATVPALGGGAAIPGQLARAAWLAVVLFIVLAMLFVLFLRSPAAPRVVARPVGALLRLVKRDPHAADGLADRLERERDDVADELGSQWRVALAASIGNRVLEYLVLLVALHAVGATPNWPVYLLAYVAATVLGMIPLTPGGLGFVEATMPAILTLSGVPFDQAALATLAYRLVTFFLPLPAGLAAFWLFNRRFGEG